MKTYRQNQMETTSIDRNVSKEGIPLERKIEQMMLTNEPIGNEKPLIYTERKDGVLKGYDIRTDRFDVALEAEISIDKHKAAQRDAAAKAEKEAAEKTQTPVVS